MFSGMRRFRPMPMTASAASDCGAGSACNSTRMPPSLAGPCRMSFGHLSATPFAPQVSSACATATPTASERPESCSNPPGKRHSSEKVRLDSGLATQLRPRLPRPAVCRSATSTVPEGAPSPACCISSVLVEAHSARETTLKRPLASPSKTGRRTGSISGEVESDDIRRHRSRPPLSPIIRRLAPARRSVRHRVPDPESCA